jgi:hypothetical protein
MARICLRWFSKPPPGGTRDNGSLDRCRDIEAFDSEPKAWFYQEAETDRNTFAVISLWGKFGGLYACAATFLYIVRLLNIFLTRLFSKMRLKRKDFQEIVRLPWAQEVSGSNPDAPTKILVIRYRQFTNAPLEKAGREAPSPSPQYNHARYDRYERIFGVSERKRILGID